MQDALDRYVNFAKFPICRVALVTAIYSASNSADVHFSDGNMAAQVPILTSLDSTVTGMMHQMIVTADVSTPTISGSDGTLEIPATLYAVVGQFYGPRVSTGGYFIIGFIRPPLSAMNFKNDPSVGTTNGSLPNFNNSTVIRHPSDVQITVTNDGAVSIQHPSGARITIGDSAVNPLQPGDDVLESGVNLEGKDVNEYYSLSKNTNLKAGVVVIDTSGNRVKLDGHGTIEVRDSAGDKITMTNGTIQVNDVVGDSIIMADGEISIANNDGSEVQINQGTVNINAAVLITIVGGEILLNDGQRPIARVGDTVVCPAGTGHITSGNPAVLA